MEARGKPSPPLGHKPSEQIQLPMSAACKSVELIEILGDAQRSVCQFTIGCANQG